MSKIDTSTLFWPRTIGLTIRDLGLRDGEDPATLMELLEMTDDQELRREVTEKLNAATYVVERLMREVSSKQFCNEPVVQSAMRTKVDGRKEPVGILEKDHKIAKFKTDPWRFLSEMQFTTSSHAMYNSPIRRVYEEKVKGWVAKCPQNATTTEANINDAAVWEPKSLTELLSLSGENAIRLMAAWCKRNGTEPRTETRDGYIKAIRQMKGF